MPIGGFEPQTDIGIAPATIADADVATSHEQVVFICPLNANVQVEILSVSCTAETLPTAASAAVTSRDASADSETVLASATDIVTSQTANEGQELFRGSKILEGGDTVFVALSGVTVGAVRGLSFVVEYRVLRHS
jgi:hypothetical protein